MKKLKQLLFLWISSLLLLVSQLIPAYGLQTETNPFHQLNIQTLGHGSVKGSCEGNTFEIDEFSIYENEIPAWSEITFQIEALPGYRLAEIYQDGNRLPLPDDENEWLWTMPDQDEDLKFLFLEDENADQDDTIWLNLQISNGGTATLSSGSEDPREFAAGAFEESVPYNEPFWISLEPEHGWMLDTILQDGKPVEDLSSKGDLIRLVPKADMDLEVMYLPIPETENTENTENIEITENTETTNNTENTESAEITESTEITNSTEVTETTETDETNGNTQSSETVNDPETVLPEETLPETSVPEEDQTPANPESAPEVLPETVPDTEIPEDSETPEPSLPQDPATDSETDSEEIPLPENGEMNSFQQAYQDAMQLYPGDVNALLWDNQLYQMGLDGQLAGFNARNTYTGTQEYNFTEVAIVSNNNQPIKNISIARAFINSSLAYCINPLAQYQTGPKVKLDASSVLSQRSIKMCSLARLYVENSQSLANKTYGAFTTNPQMQYMIIQVLTYRIISRNEPGMSFGNSHIVANGQFNWDDQVRLLNDAESFAASNMDNYTGYDASVYVTNSINDPSQPVCIFRAPTKISTGSLNLQKVSINPPLHQNNSVYSLAGAEFTVKNSAGTTVGTLKTDASGKTNTLSNLAPGNYTITETKNPAGFALRPNAENVTVKANVTTTASFRETPQSVPVTLLLTKKDAADDTPLSDVEFTFKFYGVNMDTDPAQAGHKPLKTWIMKTDDQGRIELADAWKVSGDPFYTNTADVPVLPLGTITIQETKAKEGYLENDEILVQNLKTTSNTTTNHLYSAPTLSNTPISLKVVKKQKEGNVPMDGVRFTWTDPNGKTEQITSDQLGEIALNKLAPGEHVLHEISVPAGYQPITEDIVFHVSKDGEITSNSSLAQIGVDGMQILNTSMPAKVQILKVDDRNETVPQAGFTLYSDALCTQPVSEAFSNDQGILVFEGLENGKTYWLKETTVPEHFEILLDDNGQQPVWQIMPLYSAAQNSWIFEVNGERIESQDEGLTPWISIEDNVPTLHLRIVNKVIYTRLPNTGGTGSDAAVLTGLGMAAIGLLAYFYHRKQIPDAKS